MAVPAGRRARIDVLDTWDMTIEPVAGLHSGAVEVELPSRPYLAIRVTVVE